MSATRWTVLALGLVVTLMAWLGMRAWAQHVGSVKTVDRSDERAALIREQHEPLGPPVSLDEATLPAAQVEGISEVDDDAGTLPSVDHLLRLGAVMAHDQDAARAGIAAPELRLSQAREAIAAFSDRIDTLEAELSDARVTNVRDTSDIQAKLAAATRQLELARFAERATEAELAGHPL